MPWLRTLLGRPLASSEEAEELLGLPDGVSVFGLDALGSAAYGPEAALTVMIPAGLLALHYLLALNLAITLLLLVVYFSYRQTIDAYPTGGGAYTVAGQNLGQGVGLFAGAALMLDYLLNVCVGISTGVGALISAVPAMQRFTLALCLAVLVVLTLINLRGARESGVVWRLPTLLFVVCLLTVVGYGLYKMAMHAGSPGSLRALRPIPRAAGGTAVGAWLLLRSFASGCTALTGVEAVSNGVPAFKEPKQQTAKRTLTVIVGILAVLLVGLALLVRAYGITATEPGGPGYESVLSLVTSAVVGRGWFYYVTMGSVLVVLSLSANTSFAGFPRVCRAVADDGFLPKIFSLRGRRLVYTAGIVVLSVLSAVLLVVFDGVTDRLIPLFAIGAFLAFTFSQAGMVQHWRRSDHKRARLHIAINLVGAVATGVTTLLVFVAKFKSGAWITLATLLPLVLLMRSIRRHYDEVEAQTQLGSLNMGGVCAAPLLLLPVHRWSRASAEALRFACALEGSVRVVHVFCDADDCQNMEEWRAMLGQCAHPGKPEPELIELHSPHRDLTGPMLRYVREARREDPARPVAVIFPELVAAHWYQQTLHNYRAMLLKRQLSREGRGRVAVIHVPWQLAS